MGLTQHENGTSFYTKVTQNALTEGSFTFITVMLDDPHASHLTVTAEHAVMTYGEDGQLVILEAQALQVGQRLRVAGVGYASVVSVEQSVRSKKYALFTEDCTAFANGVFVGTVCENAARSEVLMGYMREKPRLDEAFFAEKLKEFMGQHYGI